MNVNQKGFANIVLILVIAVLVGAVGYFVLVRPQPPVIPAQNQNSQPSNNQEEKQGFSGFLFTNSQNWKILEGFDIKSGKFVNLGVLPESMNMGSEPYVFNKKLYYATEGSSGQIMVFNLEIKQSLENKDLNFKDIKPQPDEGDNSLFINGILPLSDSLVYFATCPLNVGPCSLSQFDFTSKKEKMIVNNIGGLTAIKSGDASKIIVSDLDGQKIVYYEISVQPFSKKEIGYVDQSQFPKLNVVAKDPSFENVLRGDPRTSLLKIGTNDLRSDIQQNPSVVKATCYNFTINLNDQKFIGKDLVACMKL